MQWPLTSQLHGSVSQREQLFFFVTDQTPRPPNSEIKKNFKQLPERRKFAQFGVDVMITIFSDFCQFWAKKSAFFSNSNVMTKCLQR
jgi:hypothetical protein